ncbi:hypothetical protein Pmar_PMAR017714 [Perkinsus marinus ATCC 50983]|uniref:HRDC domain-containing protein n=1 Tax=Perkinsus marinus (strain ATCC 50983 / TXsc) TaxID=423536 RepID=C5L3S7_PERM5|nr:hypothetical protein Pmar_PMAR017714 [Perkinsus marinus ATCC 50983]EER08656.1 hypothetical protein Pmar_PMAR017714 [Perkinsus marinus ATCC 50983]|eukprot:XP_002776840.1 hypothetical protein Pmar_PMAR017714 [Perkinsus marinus ATCC 50983]
MRADAVFSDAVVEECIQMMPTTLEQLCQVQGLGEFRVEAYGPAILEALAGLSEDPQPTRFDSDDTESRTALDMPSLGKESRAIPDCRTVTGQQEVQCATRIGQSHVRSERDNSGKSKRSELFAFQDVALAAWRSDSGGSFFPNRELLSNRQLEPSPLPMRAEAVTPAEGAPKRRVGFYDHLFDGLF